jgi:hypothetical protein
MMNESKIQLSEEEWKLMQNSAWILTKHGIIDKVYRLFGGLAQDMQLSLQRPHQLPEAALHHSPKISKGEQYERLPWVVLDYPRHFSREHVLAVRSFFWWGNYFSSTLHLKGEFLRQLAPAMVRAAEQGRLEGYYWSAGGHEFNFNVHSADYAPVRDGMPGLAEAQDSPFLKLTVTHPLYGWDTAPEKLLESFEIFAGVDIR